MKNRLATWIHFIFATIVVISVPLQVYFIASYISGAGTGALDAHKAVGGLVHASEAVVFLSALVAFWGIWKWVGWSVLLLVLGTVQIALYPPDSDRMSGWVHGFHGLGALLVFLLAAYIAHHDMRVLGLRGGTGTASPPPTPPA